VTSVCLLRGVNVGGHAKLPMAAFRTLLEELGAHDIRHVRPERERRVRARAASRGPARAHLGGARPAVRADAGGAILGAPELAEVVAAQPFAHDDPADVGVLHVGFFVRPPGEEAALPVGDSGVAGRDEFVLGSAPSTCVAPTARRTKLNGATSSGCSACR